MIIETLGILSTGKKQTDGDDRVIRREQLSIPIIVEFYEKSLLSQTNSVLFEAKPIEIWRFFVQIFFFSFFCQEWKKRWKLKFVSFSVNRKMSNKLKVLIYFGFSLLPVNLIFFIVSNVVPLWFVESREKKSTAKIFLRFQDSMDEDESVDRRWTLENLHRNRWSTNLWRNSLFEERPHRTRLFSFVCCTSVFMFGVRRLRMFDHFHGDDFSFERKEIHFSVDFDENFLVALAFNRNYRRSRGDQHHQTNSKSESENRRLRNSRHYRNRDELFHFYSSYFRRSKSTMLKVFFLFSFVFFFFLSRFYLVDQSKGRTR